MPDCLRCSKIRPKREEHLAREGYIECLATRDAAELMQAFGQFASTRRSDVPFAVIAHREGETPVSSR